MKQKAQNTKANKQFYRKFEQYSALDISANPLYTQIRVEGVVK